jgi:hypothetical protein
MNVEVYVGEFMLCGGGSERDVGMLRKIKATFD